jgi:hypothetical protein
MIRALACMDLNLDAASSFAAFLTRRIAIALQELAKKIVF